MVGVVRIRASRASYCPAPRPANELLCEGRGGEGAPVAEQRYEEAQVLLLLLRVPGAPGLVPGEATLVVSPQGDRFPWMVAAESAAKLMHGPRL